MPIISSGQKYLNIFPQKKCNILFHLKREAKNDNFTGKAFGDELEI
jgi:hypothetical protein